MGSHCADSQLCIWAGAALRLAIKAGGDLAPPEGMDVIEGPNEGMEGIEGPISSHSLPLGAPLQDRDGSGWTQDEEDLFVEGVRKFGRCRDHPFSFMTLMNATLKPWSTFFCYLST